MNTKLFVGNLNFKTQPQTLAEFFQSVGKVKNIDIISQNRFSSKGYGFVEMENAEDAQKALDQLNKKILEDREINIEMAKPRVEGQRAPRRQGPPRRPFPQRRFNNRRMPSRRRPSNAQQPQQPLPQSTTRVYVNNLPWAVDDTALMQHFASCSPKSANVVRRQNGMSFGYGFVEFENAEQQQKAIAQLNQSQIQDRTITVKIANAQPAPGQRPPPRPRRFARRMSMTRRGPARRGPQQPPSSTRIYVANLPFSVEDQELGDMFKEYKVLEAKVATNLNGFSRGFGFVEFADEALQKEAIEKFNQQKYGDRIITVKVARQPRQQPQQTEQPQETKQE